MLTHACPMDRNAANMSQLLLQNRTVAVRLMLVTVHGNRMANG